MDNRCGRLERGGQQDGLLVGIFPGCNGAVDGAARHAGYHPTHCLRVDRRVFDGLSGSCTFAGGAT